MQIRFNINNIVESEIFYGLYSVYILGGHYVQTNPNFHIKVENTATGEVIKLTEKHFKARDFKFGKKAVKFYEFQINDYGKFRISAQNYQDIVVKESFLEVFPFPFSIPHLVLSFVFGPKRKTPQINDIEILIG